MITRRRFFAAFFMPPAQAHEKKGVHVRGNLTLTESGEFMLGYELSLGPQYGNEVQRVFSEMVDTVVQASFYQV